LLQARLNPQSCVHLAPYGADVSRPHDPLSSGVPATSLDATTTAEEWPDASYF